MDSDMETQDKKAKKKGKLTPREEKFCYYYVEHLNGSKACILAGYTEKSSRVTACKLLTKANIQQKIKELKENLAETVGISAIRIINEHSKIAFADAGQLRNGWMTLKDFEALTDDQKSCIQEVSTKTVREPVGSEKGKPVFADVEYVKIKMYDKQKSLDSITNMLGFNAPTKTEITGKNGEPLIPQTIKWGDKEIEI